MKKLVAILFVLSLGSMLLPVPTPAQDVDVRVRVAAPRAYAPVRVAPVYADAPPPPPVLLPRVGSGCYGTHQAGGCFGRTGGSCYGRTAGAGCYGSGGCYGAAYGGYAYAAPMPVAVAPYGAYLGAGRYATRTGRPPAPGIVPSNDPATRAARWIFGFDTEY